MIKKEIVFYLPEKYSFDKWVSLNKKIESICRGYGINCRTVKEKKTGVNLLQLNALMKLLF